jgi:cell division protein FtsZ
VPTTEFIKNLDVIFEIVPPVKVETDFHFITPEVKEISVRDADVFNTEKSGPTFIFDLPIAKQDLGKEEARALFDLTNETKDSDVSEPTKVVPIPEVNKSGEVRYSLEEYMEIEHNLLDSKPTANVAEPEREELKITMKVNNDLPSNASESALSPTEMSIAEASKIKADERRRKLKEFNYKFHNNPSRVDEFEKEPAYKRLGIDLEAPTQNTNSRMSIGKDSNNDSQLRSNNSFLHDNVD